MVSSGRGPKMARMNPEHDAEISDHDKGLAFDLPRLISRRRALGVLAGSLTTAALAACGASSRSSTSGSSATATAAAGGSGEIPDETAGPYPGDGTNGPNVLTESGVVRSDITKSFGDASGVAEGVPTTVEMTLLDVAKGGTPLAGAAVYLWHCTMGGQYSLYDQDVAGENYLRGVQESDAGGRVTFKTIFPAAYAGRWPHMHFEVYSSLDDATSAGSKLKTSQLALPKEVCDTVYATSGYEQSVQNLAQTSLDSDMVFSDGYASQLATTSGTTDSGISVKLNVGV
jgi:protocatechuate 3,4-dioxygenase beta subunit